MVYFRSHPMPDLGAADDLVRVALQYFGNSSTMVSRLAQPLAIGQLGGAVLGEAPNHGTT
jgi:hypothetical protein